MNTKYEWKLIKSNEDGFERYIFDGLSKYTLDLNVYRYGKPVPGVPGYPLRPKSEWTYQIVLYKHSKGGFKSAVVTPEVKWTPKIKKILRSFMQDFNTVQKIKKYHKENAK